ncbi:MAG: GNAT family N-acyltransferase, partial [Alphaproteobacteria bacterium]
DAVVGTYRLIRRVAVARHGGFYTANEYEIDKIAALDGEILELGRSCVGRDHRNRPTMQIMWRGIAAYVDHYDIQMMFGCASLPGIDIDTLAEPLSYLHHFHLAPEMYRPRALASRYVSMDLMPADAIDKRATLSNLPPLIKGYLRIGGFIGDGAVVDEQFNTTDVCVLVKTDLVTEKYIRHFERTNHDTGAN